mgnify:CR=1 FL=1
MFRVVAYALVSGLLLVSPVWGQGPTFSASSLLILSCPSPEAAVGNVVLTKISGPDTVKAGTVIILTYSVGIQGAPVVVAPAAVSKGDFVVSSSGSTATYALRNDLNLPFNDTLLFSGARLDLQGQASESIVSVFLSGGGVTFVNSKVDVAMVVPFALSPSSLSFSAWKGGPLPSSQDLSLIAGNPWTATTSANWLTVSPTLGLGSGLRSTPLTVSVNPASLASAGIYTGSVSVTGASAGCAASAAVTLDLSVPQLTVSETSLSFSGTVGDSFRSQIFIANSGGFSLTWPFTVATSSGPPSWLSASPTVGALPVYIAVTVSSAGLAAGTHKGTITISSASAPNSPVTVNVTLTLILPPTIALSAKSLTFSANLGANPAPQTFQVQNSGGGALGWTATASTQSGGNWLAVSPTTGVAPSTLTVTVNSAALPAANYSGAVTIAALPSANATNSPQVLAVALAVGIPTINPNGVVNGASFSTDGLVSPGSIASLYGIDLAAGTAAAEKLPLPTKLAGTQVLVGDVPAPLFFVSPKQINFQVPVGILGTAAPITVVSGEIRGPSAQVKLAPEAPGIFTAPPGGTGQGAVLNQDSSLNSARNPAEAGSVIQIFATGLGLTDPAFATNQAGATAEPFNRTRTKPLVFIGGIQAEVLFSALAPGFVGLYQVNARVPPGTVPGAAVPLQLQAGGKGSNIVSIAVR